MPKRNTLVATAETPAQFCERFPRGTARFLTPRAMKRRPTGAVFNCAALIY